VAALTIATGIPPAVLLELEPIMLATILELVDERAQRVR
jgi:hypothetical protein